MYLLKFDTDCTGEMGYNKLIYCKRNKIISRSNGVLTVLSRLENKKHKILNLMQLV